MTCRGRSDVAIVRSHGLARVIPLQEDLAAGETQWLVSNSRDSRAAVVASDIDVDARLVFGDVRFARVTSTVTDDFEVCGVVGRDSGCVISRRTDAIDMCIIYVPIRIWLVDNVETGEILPDQTSVVLRTRADVLRKQSPMPGLRDAFDYQSVRGTRM